MTSQIDPTKPQDGELASKADLRANLQAAKTEIEQTMTPDLGALAEIDRDDDLVRVYDLSAAAYRKVTPAALTTGLVRNPMAAALDAGDASIFNARAEVKPVASATYTVGASDFGRVLRFTRPEGCVVTLPSAAAVGQHISWSQGGDSLRFEAASGAVIEHPLDHHDGLGKGALGTAILIEAGPNAVWNLAGMTKLG